MTFGATETSKTFTFSATDDSVDDDGESVQLGFGTLPTLVSAGTPATSTVSIADDDDPAVTVSFGAASHTVAEGDDVTVTVELSADPEREVTVPLTATNQGGATSADYSGVPASVTFSSGDTSKTFTFTATDDSVDDDGESVLLSFGALPTLVSAGRPSTSTVRIADDDDPAVTVSFGAASYSVAEGDDVTVTVELSAAAERSVTVPITTTNQDGATDADYSGVPASVTFSSGDTSKTFTFTATDDSVDDDGESVLLGFGTLPTLVSAGSTATSTVRIADDDDPAVTVSFGAAAYTVAEGDDVTVTVELSADPERSVTVPLTATNQGGATSGDYSGVPASVTFGATETSKTFTFTATQDAIDDDGESVLLSFGTLPDRVSASTTTPSATVTILDDDDPAVTVSFGAASYSVAEGDDVTVTVELSAAPEREVTVPLTATNQDGATSADYSGVPASVTFGATETSQTFTFTATDDSVDDDGESVLLSFGTLPTLVTAGTPATTTVRIADDDDPAVTVSFGRAAYTVAEGDDVTVTVELSAAPERSVTVPLTATNQGGATSGDYSGVPASVTFGATETSKTFTFSATQDTVDDDGESVLLGFGTLPTLVSAGSTATTTVRIADDDDPAVTVSFGAASYSVAEGDDVTVTVELSADPERSVTVPLTATNQGGATSGDYSGVPASVTFDSGETSQTFTFSATQDTVDDDGESVLLGFGTLPTLVTARTPATTTVRIADDDDPAVTVSFGAASYSVAEGDDVTVTVELSADPERSVTVPITRSNQDGATSADYSGVPASVTFDSGETSKTFTFTATQDTVDDDGESVLLSFGTLPTLVTAGTPATSTVRIADDDDPAVTVSFGAAAYTVAEGDDVTVTVELSAAPERSVTVPLTATNQGGATDADYSGVPASVTFSATETSKTFTFSATQDTVDDDGESVLLGFGTLPTLVSAGTPATTTVRIADDDDPAVTVSFGAASYSVAEGGDVTVTVELSADPERSVTIPITRSNQGGATSADYSIPASVTFDSGETSKTFTFTATDDSVDDDGESVLLGFGTLPTLVSAGTPATSTVRIADDDDPAVTVSFGAASYTVAEGDDVTVTVELSADPERSVTVPLTATNQDGATDADYSGVPSSVTFSSGETSKTFTFTATDDSVDDDGESVLLGFGTLPTLVSAGTPATTTVRIADDDDPAVTVSFGQASHTVAEGDDVTVTVELSADPERSVTIPITRSNQDGATDADYSGVPSSVTFDSGETSKTFTFSATDDSVDDDGESVLLGFGTLPDRVSASTTTPSATVTILDDDARGVTVSPTSLPVDEGMTAEYTVVLKSEPTGNVTVTINDPTDNTDVTAAPASLTFDENDWDTPKTVTVSALQDADGVNETATVTHTVSGADYALETASDVSVTVDDDETPDVTIVPTGITVLPGGSNEYTVVLDTEPTVQVTVTVTGHADTVLSVSPEQLTFDANDWDTPKTVEVSADDSVTTTETITLAHGLAGGEYGSVTAGDVDVTVVKASGVLDFQIGITASPQALTVPEDKSRSYSVVLSAVPTGDVTVTVNLPTGNDLSINKSSLTFTTDNWNVPQAVRVSAADDDDGIPDAPVTIGHTVSGGGYGSGDSFGITVTIEENDTREVTLSTVSLVIAEGKEATYTVALDTQPSDDVTVVINDPTDNTDVTAAPASLTFTRSNWSAPQTVTVTTVADHDTDTDTATITHTVSGGDYATVTAKNVDVTVTDGCPVIWCGVLIMEKDPGSPRHLRFVSLDDDDFEYKGTDYRIDYPKLYGGPDPQEDYSLTVRIPERAWFKLDVRGPLYETEHYLDWTLYVNGVELPFGQAKRVWDDIPGNWRILFKWYGREFHELFPPGDLGNGRDARPEHQRDAAGHPNAQGARSSSPPHRRDPEPRRVMGHVDTAPEKGRRRPQPVRGQLQGPVEGGFRGLGNAG